MTRFVIDAEAALHLVRHEIAVAEGHELLAPTLLRSHVLSHLHEAVHRGELDATVAKDEIAKVRGLGLRLLGDAVLQRTAWKVADELDWSSTYLAEYVALTQLQADALFAFDPMLVDGAARLVTLADVAQLTSG